MKSLLWVKTVEEAERQLAGVEVWTAAAGGRREGKLIIWDFRFKD